MEKSTSYPERARLRLSRTPEFYRSFVRDYPRSGLSIPEYCRRHNVGESTFRKYRQAHSPAGKRASSAPLPRMVRVLPATPSPAPAQGFEVMFPGSALLRLPHLDQGILAALAPVLLGRGA